MIWLTKDVFLHGLGALCKSIFYCVDALIALYLISFKKSDAREDIVNPIVSARLVTSDSFSFTYGVVEIKAQMAKGDWLSPGKIHDLLISMVSFFPIINFPLFLDRNLVASNLGLL